MKPLLTSAVIGLALMGCGTGDFSDTDSNHEATAPNASDTDTQSLELRPRVELVGLEDIYDALQVDRLSFAAEIFVIPAEDATEGAAASIRFDLRDGESSTRLLGQALSLAGTGRYQVLVRVRPNDEDVSVRIEGEYLTAEEIEARGKDEEPAPIPADESENPADEPAPIPADEAEEPAPIPADEAEEPAPIPADEADEPAPIPADDPDAPPSAEPAPIPADVPGEEREKGDDVLGFDHGSVQTEGDPILVTSGRAFEFYAGVVDVKAGSTELVVMWDVRSWLRALLAEPLGLPAADRVADEEADSGFSDVPRDFHIRAR